MDSLKLECFLAVAESNSFSKAANVMFKNQSVLSRQVMALEEELGVKLFERKGRGICLTPAGQVFRDGIIRLEEIYSSLLSDVLAAEKGHTGEVKIATHPGNLYFSDLVPLVQEFEKRYPNINVNLTTAYSGDISKQLDDKRIDLAFWRWEEYISDRRDYQPFSAIDSGLLVLPDHPMAQEGAKEPTLADFKKTVADYLAWEVGNLLRNKKVEEGGLGK